MGSSYYRTLNERFWARFAKGTWEPYTFDLYNKHIDSKTGYFDLGCWIGPTVIYANEAGAKNIFALEANPETFDKLQKNCYFNKEVLAPFRLKNACIFKKDGEVVPFGMSPGREDDTSCCSVRGGEFQVPTITLKTIFKENADLISDKNFVKLDIEGFESEIMADIMDISKFVNNVTVMLSLHPPFWKNLEQATEQTLKLYDNYEVSTVEGEPLPKEQLKEMLLWQGEGRPEWSTHHGNFFEIMLGEK